MRSMLTGLGLVILCLTVYLPGLTSIPVVDRDEARFAQASRQMFESVSLPEAEQDPVLTQGGLAIPMVAGKERLNKPPLIYWLQAACAAIFTGNDPGRDAIWMYRVPSLIAGLVIVLTTWRLGCSMFGPREGFLAAAMLAVAPVFVWEAHQARADMVMIAWTTLAMGQLWLIWLNAKRGNTNAEIGEDAADAEEEENRKNPSTSVRGRMFVHAVLLWLFVGLGIMTKGPITPMIVGLTALTISILTRRWHWLWHTKPIIGVVIVAFLVVPWVVAVSSHVGFDHYISIIADEVFGRAGQAKEGHWGPPGYHLVLLVVLFWPGVLLTACGLSLAWHTATARPKGDASLHGFMRRFMHRIKRFIQHLCSRWASVPESFLLAWLVPTWLLFELVGTKLPHYTMPLYPAVALLSARAVVRWSTLDKAQQKKAIPGIWFWTVLGFAIACAVGYLLTTTPMSVRTILGMVILSFGLFILIAIVRLTWKQQPIRAQIYALPAAVAILIAFLVGVAPAYFSLTTQADLQARAIAAPSHSPIAWVGFFEDSVVFLDRGTPILVEPDALMGWLNANPDGVAILSDNSNTQLVATLEAANISEHATITGKHYTKGQRETLYLFSK